MFISKTGDKGALLRTDSHIGYLDFQTGVVSLFASIGNLSHRLLGINDGWLELEKLPKVPRALLL